MKIKIIANIFNLVSVRFFYSALEMLGLYFVDTKNITKYISENYVDFRYKNKENIFTLTLHSFLIDFVKYFETACLQ